MPVHAIKSFGTTRSPAGGEFRAAMGSGAGV
jgi:hypothetical protein